VESGTESDLQTAEAHEDMLWAFGTSGTMLNSSDGGVTWQPFDSPTSSDLITSDSAFGALVVVGEDGTVLLMKEGGRAWKDVSIPVQMDVSDIALTSNGSLVAVGPAGAIWQYDGNAWRDRSIGVEHDLLSVSFLDSENGLISGNSGTILASTDGGVVWDYRDAPDQVSSKNIVSIDYFSAIRAYAITDEGHILRSSREGNVTVGFVWNLVEIESHGRSTSLGVELNSIEVLSTNKILFTGPNGYLSLSKDGGNIVSKQMLPIANDTNFNGVAMIDNFKGIAVADGGSVLWTDNSGEEKAVGFQIIDFRDFGQFVDYSKGMLIDGLMATIKIVLFGIAMGFTIGVLLSMLKTSPTTLKNVAQSNRYQLVMPFAILANVLSIGRLTTNIASLRAKSAEISATRPINTPAIKLFGLAMMLAGIGAFLLILGDVWALNLLGWERIYVPVGDSGAFAYILLGTALALLGLTFLSFNDEFSTKEVPLPIIPPIAMTLIFVGGGYPLSGEDSLVDLLMTGSEFAFSLTILVTLLLLASVTYFLGRPEVFTLISKADKRNLALFFTIYEGIGIIIFWLAKISGTIIVHDLDIFLWVTATNAAYILGAKKGWLNGDKTVPCTLVVLLTMIILFQKIVEFNLMRGIGANEESALLVLVGTASFIAAITSGRKLSLNPWGVRPLNSIATLYTDFFRNTPLIVQFMFIHFGLQLGKLIQEPGMLILEGRDDPISSFMRDGILADRAYISAIFALGLNSGAYQCETIRGAIAAIPSGQMEAGRSIGLNYMQTMKLVIMPQAIRICIPPLGNEMVNLVLNSSLAMVIGYAELTRQGKLIIAVTFQIFWTWGMVMISYFIVTWTLALILRHLENKTRIPGLGISGGA
jgi:polar amino acid transport system permease protein